MAGGEVAEGAVAFGIVLDEDEVPDFDALVGTLVDEGALRGSFGREVHMQFGAGAAGAGFAHHPEVVLHIAVDDVDVGVQSFAAEVFGPAVPCFLVDLPGSPLLLSGA